MIIMHALAPKLVFEDLSDKKYYVVHRTFIVPPEKPTKPLGCNIESCVFLQNESGIQKIIYRVVRQKTKKPFKSILIPCLQHVFSVSVIYDKP